jgi:hypothetical protein
MATPTMARRAGAQIAVITAIEPRRLRANLHMRLSMGKRPSISTLLKPENRPYLIYICLENYLKS